MSYIYNIYNIYDIYNIKTFKKFITFLTLNDTVKIFQKFDVTFLVTYQKTLTRKSNILLVEVNGDACVEPHNKKGEARQDEQL